MDRDPREASTAGGFASDADEAWSIVVGPGASRRWAFIFRWHGKLKEMGLGSLTSVSLSDAREKAGEARRVLAAGRNPIEVRRALEATRDAATTFGAFADELVKNLSHGFRNEKHKAQWVSTLTTHAARLRKLKLDEIGTDDVLAVLQPIWQTKNETASRLRGRIERVLDAATAKGLRSGANPARWRGHLDALLPKRQKLTRGHHAAMPYPGRAGLCRPRTGLRDRLCARPGVPDPDGGTKRRGTWCRSGGGPSKVAKSRSR